MIALLAVDRLVNIAQLFEGVGREQLVDDLGLLQAQDVRLLGFEKVGDQSQPQSDGIYVPCRELHLLHSTIAGFAWPGPKGGK